jgi:4-deoxy-L-threo-5-hexosulose-uronate ketol-isomerase
VTSTTKTIDERQAAHPRDVKGYDTHTLREDFLIERIFVPGEVTLTYSHYDRMIVGGAMPAAKAADAGAFRADRARPSSWRAANSA